MSLRTRLLAGLVALAAIGLVVMGAVTYFEQRSFLYKRVDQQALEASATVSRALDNAGQGGSGCQVRPRGGGPQGAGPQDGGPGGGAPPDAGPLFGPPPAREGLGGPPPGPGTSLPAGTFGERRDADGNVIARCTVYGQTLAAPNLPRSIPSTTTEHPRLITVGSHGRSGLSYRVFAFPTSDLPRTTTIVAVPLREVSDTLNRLLIDQVLVAAGVLLALATLGWLVIRVGLRPLDRIGRTAGAIAAGDLSRRVEPANDRTEVGRLGLALNAMLGQIERAFGERRASEERLRRFLADASHELRTPLASIRGYAELFRIGAARDPADVDKAMRRIEEEAARMGVLVEDLLALARLDELREPKREPVDLVQLARDARDDARATAPQREIELEADGPAIVQGDTDQLRQVIGNLVRNALVHTPSGTPIELRVAPEDGKTVTLEVRDHGPGLPADDPSAVFERFWRADRGRERGPAGAGLGLAIVAGVVSAHGGRVEAHNAASGGARFVIALPRAGPSGDPGDHA